MPRAYTISDVVLKDPDAADAYRTRAAASIAAFGAPELCAAELPRPLKEIGIPL